MTTRFDGLNPGDGDSHTLIGYLRSRVTVLQDSYSFRTPTKGATHKIINGFLGLLCSSGGSLEDLGLDNQILENAPICHELPPQQSMRILNWVLEGGLCVSVVGKDNI